MTRPAMEARPRWLTPVLLGLCLVLATPHLGLAQVQLPAMNLGETNFEDGFSFPGVFVEEFPETYVAGATDVRNRPSGVKVTLRVSKLWSTAER